MNARRVARSHDVEIMMRPVIALALSILATAPTFAADFPVLRGGFTPAPMARATDDQTQWDGFYAGGFASYSSGRFTDYSATSPNSMMANFYNGSSVPALYRQAQNFVLALGSDRRAGAGGFIGYNMAFGDAVVGVEADLSWVKMSSRASQTFIVSDINGPGVGYSSLTGSSTSRLDGYATFRARAGWAYGSIMPYLTGGLAVGKGSHSSTLTLAYSATADGTLTQTTGKSLSFVVGGTIGAGVDALIANNILLRAEYQFTKFASNAIPLDLHTVRIGAGVKF
jgi:outer membrane immunogenic protein